MLRLFVAPPGSTLEYVAAQYDKYSSLVPKVRHLCESILWAWNVYPAFDAKESPYMAIFFLLFVALGRSASGRKGCHCGCQQFQVSIDPLWSVECGVMAPLGAQQEISLSQVFYQIRWSCKQYARILDLNVQIRTRTDMCSQGDQCTCKPSRCTNCLNWHLMGNRGHHWQLVGSLGHVDIIAGPLQ